MATLSALAKQPKWILYEKYLRLIYSPAQYEQITRSQMLEEIVAEYSNDDLSLYHLCTARELELLQKIYYHPEKSIDCCKYCWEINELSRKLIIDSSTNEIYDEQRKNVKKALQKYKIRPQKGEDDVLAFMIGAVRLHGDLPEDTVCGFTADVTGLEPQRIAYLAGHNPMFHFYCGVSICNIEESIFYNKFIFHYQDYENRDLLSKVVDIKKRHNVVPDVHEFCPQDYIDMFYCGMPLSKASVKKFYDSVKKLKREDQNLILSVFDDARVLADPESLDDPIIPQHLSAVQELMKKAWDDTPSSALQGISPREWRKQKKIQDAVDAQFITHPQKHANLSDADADEFYELYFALLEYVNQTKHISSQIQRIFRQKFLDPTVLQPIDEYLWSHKKLIGRFVTENPYDFTSSMLEAVTEFKKAISRDMFIVIGYEEDYAKIFSPQDHKIFMVKGIRGNFDEILPKEHIPAVIKTTLLNFRGQIIYNGFYQSCGLMFGANWKKQLLEDSAEAQVCYLIE